MKGKAKSGTRSKRGKNSVVPSTQKALQMSQAQISNLTAAAQRKLLVKLNREANKRLETISSNLTKNRLKPTHISESEVLKGRLSETKKGWRITPGKRFKATKNLTKAQMQEEIKQTIFFLRSPVSTVSGLKKMKVENQQELVKLYNRVHGLTEGDAGYKATLSQKQYDQMGRMINALRKNHELIGGYNDPKYVQELAKVGDFILQNKSNQDVDDWIRDLEERVLNLEQKRYKEKQAEEAQIRSYFDV